jgi:excisionase family DNA binding protein
VTLPALSASLELPEALVEELADRVAAILVDRQPEPCGYLDAAAAATYLSTSRDRIHDFVAAGHLRPARDGRRLLFRRADLDAYLDES